MEVYGEELGWYRKQGIDRDRRLSRSTKKQKKMAVDIGEIGWDMKEELIQSRIKFGFTKSQKNIALDIGEIGCDRNRGIERDGREYELTEIEKDRGYQRTDRKRYRCVEQRQKKKEGELCIVIAAIL